MLAYIHTKPGGNLAFYDVLSSPSQRRVRAAPHWIALGHSPGITQTLGEFDWMVMK